MSDETNANPNAHPDPERLWKNRHKGSQNAWRWIVTQTLLWGVLGYYDTEIIEAMGVVIAWSYGASLVPILGYYCNTAIEEYVKNKNFP